MLTQTYSYAVENREKLLQQLDLKANQELFREAERRWISFQPEVRKFMVCAIDSSWNYLKYHGYYLYSVEAVSVFPDGTFAAEPRYEVGINTLMAEDSNSAEIIYNPMLYLSSIGMDYEYSLALQSRNECDFVFIDGSLLARYYDRRRRKSVSFHEYAKDLMKEKKLVFVAKTSESNVMLNGSLGDIYYFTKATKKSGYSKPYFDSIGITVFYARLDDYQPCIKVEVPGELNEEDCKQVFNALGTNRFNGYPYPLRLAHERCKVSDDDMQVLASVLGLDVEAGAREVLNE
ncbi:MAG: DNA double-strand break repair nuclease NurA [Conexivisphaerales archaeon]